jgi:hypothetical protein
MFVQYVGTVRNLNIALRALNALNVYQPSANYAAIHAEDSRVTMKKGGTK